MSFIGCNILGSDGVGSKIYQPIGGGLCDVSIYESDSFKYNEPFVNDPPEPATGNISTIGYRDPATGEFTNIYNSVYTNGVIEQSVDYTETDGIYSPVTDGVLHSSANNEYMDTGVVSDINYATEWKESYFISVPTNPVSTLTCLQSIKGSAALRFQVVSSGRVTFTGVDDTGGLLFSFNTVASIADGSIKKLTIESIDTVAGTTGNYDINVYINDVFDNGVTDISYASGWTINRFLTGSGATSQDYRWYEFRSTLIGLWIFDGRLKPIGDATQGNFENIVNSAVMALTNDIGIYPNAGATYYLDREGFNV